MFLIMPYRIERPFKMPWATIGIMVACAVVYVIQLLMGFERSYEVLGFKPNVWAPITWLTSMFAHGGLLHLAGNLYFLWVFGAVLEDAIGQARYLAIYFAGGIVSALTHSLMMLAFNPQTAELPLVGASGAIAAIMGVAAVRFYRLKLRVWWFLLLLVIPKWGTFTVTALLGVGLWFVRELFTGLLMLNIPGGGVANWAHIGGLAFGAAAAYAFRLARDLDFEDATTRAENFEAMGRYDLAASSMAAAGFAAKPSVQALNRARRVLESGLSEPSAAMIDTSAGVNALLREGNVEEAARVWAELTALAKGATVLDARTLLALGNAAERAGDLATASRAYYATLKTHPCAPEAENSLYRLAHVYLAQGRSGDATATWRTFKSHFPLSVWTAYADDRLVGQP